VLAKGPVGLALPLAVVVLFLRRSGRIRLLLDRRLLLGALAFCLIALPWYVWVAVETKGNFLRGFIEKHNVGRFISTMENHRGPFYYYLGVLMLGFAPWSIFLGPVAWYSTGMRAHQDSNEAAESASRTAAYRFLWCWVAVYFIFFSFSA